MQDYRRDPFSFDYLLQKKAQFRGSVDPGEKSCILALGIDKDRIKVNPVKEQNMIGKYKSNDGQALVEFAITLPLLVLMLAGMVEFGILFYNKQVLTNASREGARAGIVYLLNSGGAKLPVDIQKIARDYCAGRLVTFGAIALPTVTPTSAAGLSYPSDLTVTVTYPYAFLMPSILNMFGASFGPTLDIAGVTAMKME